MEKIEQLVYTWSDVGLSGQTEGFRVRAASQRLSDTRGPFYRKLAKYLPYHLPPGVHASSITEEEAPLCLAFINTGTERILVRREFLATDGFGRPGAYLTHLLAGLPMDFSAREAILLWHSKLWVTSKNPLDRQTLLLDPLSEEQLSSPQGVVWQMSGLDNFRIALRRALTYFLSTLPPYKLYPSGASESIAALIWGVTQSLPPKLLPGMTFSTYEPSRSAGKETVVGLFAGQSLSAGEVTFYDYSIPSLPAGQEERIEQYIDFVVECLIQRIEVPRQVKDQLALFIDKIEKNVKDVNDILNKYQIYQEEEQERRRREYQEEEKLRREYQEEERRKQAHQEQMYQQEREMQRSVLASTERSMQEVPSDVIQDGTTTSSLQSAQYRITQVKEAAVHLWRKLERFRWPPTLYYGVLLISLILNVFLISLLITYHSNSPSAADNLPTRIASPSSQTPTQPVQTTPPPEKLLNNEVTFIKEDTIPRFKTNTSFTFSVHVRNSGSSIWNGQQYQLECIPNPYQGQPDLDCPIQKTLAFVNTPIAPGQTYTFTFKFVSPDPPGTGYWIKIQMFQNQTPFGNPQLLMFTIIR